jgi:carbonic anhydrase
MSSAPESAPRLSSRLLGVALLAGLGAVGLDPRVLALGLILLVAATPASALASGHSGNPHTIESALKALKAGNDRFVSGAATHPSQNPEVLETLARDGQTPLAAVLGCSDSRAPVEELFDLGFGDLFVIRAAGAVPGVDQVGSLEYAVAHLGVPVILVLSHTNCGAVTAALAGAEEPGALGELIGKLSPVIQAVRGVEESKRLQAAVELSASMFRDQLPRISPVLAKALAEGRLAIVGGVLDIATGKVVIDEGPAR